MLANLAQKRKRYGKEREKAKGRKQESRSHYNQVRLCSKADDELGYFSYGFARPSTIIRKRFDIADLVGRCHHWKLRNLEHDP
jgi:hypothetical protein